MREDPLGTNDGRRPRLTSRRARRRWAGAATCGRRRRGRSRPMTVPPSALATWATMASPRPDPGRPAGGGRAVEAVEDVGQVRLGDARAMVVHDDHARRGTGPTPSGPAGSTCARCRAGCPPHARAGRRGPRPSRARRRARTSRPWPARGWSAPRRRRARAGRGGGPPVRRLLVTAGQLGQVADEVRELLELHQHVVDEDVAVLVAQLVDAADHLEVRAQAGERACAARGTASSTSWLWARREDSSASSRRLKVRRRRPSSSGPPGERRRETSVVSATSSTVSVREFSGTSAVRADEPAQHDGEQHADEGDAPEQEGKRLELRAGVEQRRDLQRAAVDEDARRRPACWRAGARPARASGSRRRSTVVKKAGARLSATSRHLSGHRQPASGDHGAAGFDDLAQGGGGGPDLAGRPRSSAPRW